MTQAPSPQRDDTAQGQMAGDAFDPMLALARRWKFLVLAPLAAAAIAIGITYVIGPTFTARTSFLPPQQQGMAATALSSLGALANLAGGGGLRTPADQFVALLQSTSVQDRIIDRFDLVKVYDVDLRADARKELSDNVRILLSKRDGIIAVEVDDKVPKRAADMANAYVDELRRLTTQLAITEAQQRRVFFDGQLKKTRDSLAAAQVALQASGFNAGALKAEPKAAAESYARLKAEITAAEVRLQSLRGALTDGAPEVVQLQSALSVLRGQLARAEQVTDSAGGADYVGKYREFKYQEALFELFARQYELARVDEAREGALIQVIDTAQPPEKKSKPSRSRVAIGTLVAAALLLAGGVLLRSRWIALSREPRGVQLKRALRGQ